MVNTFTRPTVPDLVVGASYRVRLRVKMLSGDTTLVSSLEGATEPAGLFRRSGFSRLFGSPGEENTVLTTSLPPYVNRLTNSPVEPRSTDSVAVTCRVRSVQPISTVELSYRAGDASGTVSLLDDGQHADGLAGDGIFGSPLPSFPHSTLVRYTITAADVTGASWTFPQGHDPSGRAAFYVHDDQPASAVPVYHLLRNDINALSCTD